MPSRESDRSLDGRPDVLSSEIDGAALSARVRHVRDLGRDAIGRVPIASGDENDESGATDGTVGTAPTTGGSEPPRQLADAIPLVERAFAFVDLCGFTTFVATNGEHAAIDALTAFRLLVRDIATRRGILVEKWLGDGAMLVGTDVSPTIAAAVELIARHDGQPLALRGGVAHGQVLIFDGDDYIGRPTNLAARLCQVARPGELLAVGYSAATLPQWTQVAGTRTITLRGIGRLPRVQQLTLVPGLELPTLTPHRATGT
ncbi:MAG: adenylate/guanylate cyclase domain-containing protein [Acidimicrobiia bacterium]